MGRAATGKQFLRMYSLDSPNGDPDLNVGSPVVDALALGPPAATMTAATGDPGNLTGASVTYKVAFLATNGRRTLPSAATAAVAPAADEVDLAVIPTSGDARVIGRIIYRSTDGVNYYRIKILRNNTATTYTDNLSLTSAAINTKDRPLAPTVADPTTAPAAVLAGAGVGLVEEGEHDYAYTIVTGLGESAPSAVTTVDVIDNATDGKVAVTVPVGPTGTTSRKVYRSAAGLTALKLLATIADNTTTAYEDNIADASLGAAAPTASAIGGEVGRNFGFRGEYVESAGPEATYGNIPSKELRAMNGPARAMPGSIKVEAPYKRDVRPIYEIETLCRAIGKPTSVTYVADEPVVVVVFDTDAGPVNPYSSTELWYEGGAVAPEIFYGTMVSDIDEGVDENQIVSQSIKSMGIAHTLAGIGEVVAAGDYSNAGYHPLVRMIRSDAGTEALRVKITVGASAGTFTFKCKRTAAASYDGPALTGYYSATTGKMTTGGVNPSPWIELYGDDSTAIGFDVGENRLPFEIFFPGNCALLTTNAEFSIPLVPLIPGVGDASSAYSGAPAQQDVESRFGEGHVTLLTGTGATPDTLARFTAASYKFSSPLKPYSERNASGRHALDFDRTGDFGASLTLTRRYNSRLYQSSMHKDQRYAVKYTLQGAPILIDPGVFSSYRHSIVREFGQMRVESVKRATGGPDVTEETVELVGEQPDDTAIPFLKVTVTTDRDVRIPT